MNKHDTLLLACGSQENRRYIRHILGERYHLLEAGNAPQALLLMEQNRDCIAALILDISSSQLWDITLQKKSKYSQLLGAIPTIVLCEEETPDLVHQAFHSGAADVIPLNYEPYALLCRIETIVNLYLHKLYFENRVREQATVLQQSNESIVDVLSSIIEYRSTESGQHILRIRHFTRILLEEVSRSCPEYGLDERNIAIISSASALHDIGKIAIPDFVLMKHTQLTPEERAIMNTHVRTGCEILDSIGGVADKEYLCYAYNICRYHHERWDGSGYPEGITGDDIPICAQVVGLADAYDALRSKRRYRDAYSHAEAVNIVLKGECGSFSPKLLECFKHVAESFGELAKVYADGKNTKGEEKHQLPPIPKGKEAENSLERIQAKYTALVHYINGMLIEVDLNQDLFHLIYNPYPDMTWIHEISSFSQMIVLLNECAPDGHPYSSMAEAFWQSIRNFMDQDLRRTTHRFRFYTRSRPEGDNFEVTLLRINTLDPRRRSLAILCRRIQEKTNLPLSSDMPISILSGSTLVCRNDKGLTLEVLGEHTTLLAGYTREELRDQFDDQLMELVVPEDRQKLRSSFREQSLRGKNISAEFRVRRKDGAIIWVLDQAQLTVGPDGREFFNSRLHDVTQFRQDYEEQKKKLDRLEIILAQTENVLFEWDLLTDTVVFSETWEKLMGFAPGTGSVREAIRDGAYIHPDDIPLFSDTLAKLENGSGYEMVEVRMATAWGRYLWCRFRATAIRNKAGELEKISGIIINIDAEKQAEWALKSQANRDSLTKLLNKKAARSQAEEYLAQFAGKANCAMLIIDLDNFKHINDHYGHMFGDTVLIQVSRSITKMFRDQDIVARIGGDEFLVLVRGGSDRTLLQSRCQRLLNVLTGLFQEGERKLPLSCSIGISLCPEHGTSYYELFNRADQALYRAKAKGKNGFQFYDPKEAALPAQTKGITAANNPIDSDEEPGLVEDNIVRVAFQKLYTSQDEDGCIQEILAMMGKRLNVSRVYVFENSEDNRFCSNTYEWCNTGISAEIDNLQNVSYETDIPGYPDNFDERGIFYCPEVEVLTPSAYEITQSQGIRSMLQCAIREGDVFRGFIGFDECVERRMWTKDHIQILSYFSGMLSVFLLKRREHKRMLDISKDMSAILDSQNAQIYIMDPDTWKLKYLNARAQQLAPGTKCGMLCYQALRGRTTPCPGCPAVGIRERKNNSACVCWDSQGKSALVDAGWISWRQGNACLITAREIPGKEC